MTATLSEAQLAMLRRIVATNGGGVWVEYGDLRTLRALERRELAQGKKGSPGWAVHTRAGLDLVRSMDHHDDD
jgi:hypothetical protein